MIWLLLYLWAGFALACWHLAYCLWEDLQYYHPLGSKYVFRHGNKWGPNYKNSFVWYVTLLIALPVLNVLVLLAIWFFVWRYNDARSV